MNKEELKFLSMNANEKTHFTVYYVRQDVDIDKCKLQEEELEEVKCFKIEELQDFDNEGFEWLDNLKKVIQ